MKQFLILAAAVTAVSLSTLSAQSFEGVRVHFDQTVQVAGSALPAGDYSITMIKSNSDVPVLKFSSDHGSNLVVFASREPRLSGGSAGRTEVVLDKKDSVERVVRIEIEGSSVDFVLQ